jgi:hypothetical protein
MMWKKLGILGIVAGALLLGASGPVLALDPPSSSKARSNAKPQGLYPRDERKQRALEQFMRHDRARSAVKAGEIRPLGEIRQRVSRQFPGRIVGVELYEQGGGRKSWIYDVRVLKQTGDVLSVKMDARTGNVLSVKGRR